MIFNQESTYVITELIVSALNYKVFKLRRIKHQAHK